MGGGAASSAADVQTSGAASAADSASVPESPIPLGEFTAESLTGDTIDQTVFADHKLTVINVWATFCGPCKQEMPCLLYTSGMVAVGLNSAAYMSEVIRSGIGAVPGGQMEAARCVGMSHWKAMQHVVLPQAVRNILPAMCNEFVTIIKETSILGMVGIVELMFRAQSIAKQTYICLLYTSRCV